MNKSASRYLTIGWILVVGLGGTDRAALAGEPEPNLRITVYVYNWAQVEPNMLRKAKEAATYIFRNAGVDAALLDAPPPSPEEQGKVFRQSNFSVQILSRPMAESFGFPTQVLGIAPGKPQELDRSQVYVSDPVAKRMAQEQVMALVKGIVSHNANKGQILGHGMAHEIGHILLQQASHSPIGLMRAHWDRQDLQNMVSGGLLFTPEEAERIRAEVVRRNEKEAALEVAAP